jgi:hypothetical protein
MEHVAISIRMSVQLHTLLCYSKFYNLLFKIELTEIKRTLCVSSGSGGGGGPPPAPPHTRRGRAPPPPPRPWGYTYGTFDFSKFDFKK